MRDVKTVIVVGDGMADEPLDALSGKTPLQAARTPNMDLLAREGVVGTVRSIPQGMPPGSDIANMSLMGYDPARYYTGRAPLEAASLGVALGERDLAFRCNLVTLDEGAGGRVMADYSGGGISSEPARALIRLLNERVGDKERTFHAGVSYRHLLVWREAERIFHGVKTTPPHDISGRPVVPYLPDGPGGDLLRRFMERAGEALSGQGPSHAGPFPEGGPNAIWLWGEGASCRLPALEEKLGVRGAVVCAVDLIKGIGRCAGMSVVRVPGATGDIDTNFQGKAVAALRALRDHDLVLLHVESPDEASHRGDLEEKIRSIERIDREVLGVLCAGVRIKGLRCRMLVLPDHATPVRTRTHCERPVPFLLAGWPPGTPLPAEFVTARGKALGYDEAEAGRAAIRLDHGYELLSKVVGCTE